MNFNEITQALRDIKQDPNFTLMESSTESVESLKAQESLTNLIEKAVGGSPLARHALIQEAMTTADFPNLFGNILSRDVHALYSEFPAPWQTMSERTDLPDFRNRETFPQGTIDQVLSKASDDGMPAAENRNYTDPTAVTWGVDIYQATTELSFKQIQNDDLRFFSKVPAQFARAANRTELKVWTQTHWGATGPTNLTQITDNPTLTVANLKAAVAQVRKAVDAGGEPIMIEAPILEVGPDLEVTAHEIIKATALDIAASTGSTGIRVTENWVSKFISNVVVNPYIPIVASSSNADTSWCLLANSSRGAAAFEHGWLSGMAGPQIYMKAPNMQRVGGGVNAAMGDFHTLSTQYKVLDIFGVKLIDSRLGFMSNGTGSS